MDQRELRRELSRCDPLLQLDDHARVVLDSHDLLGGLKQLEREVARAWADLEYRIR